MCVAHFDAFQRDTIREMITVIVLICRDPNPKLILAWSLLCYVDHGGSRDGCYAHVSIEWCEGLLSKNIHTKLNGTHIHIHTRTHAHTKYCDPTPLPKDIGCEVEYFVSWLDGKDVDVQGGCRAKRSQHVCHS